MLFRVGSHSKWKWLKNNTILCILFILFVSVCLLISCTRSSKRVPLRAAADLNVGESMDIKLSSGEIVSLKLLAIDDTRDELRDAVRSAYAKVSVDGTEIILNSGNYNLPVSIGKVQIDCPITKAYYSNSNRDSWGLAKDARFRLWPKDSPYIAPRTFVYPIKQRWFASDTHMSNEPCYVDWGENPGNKKIYYHNGLDFGGSEEMDEVVSASDGLVISSKGDTLAGYTDFPSDIRTDVVWIIDNRGWYYRYSHLFSIDDEIQPGTHVKMGQRIGLLGKEGHSGGWTHLHFGIHNKETSSGKWGTEEGYVYLWESYINEYSPALIAVARPHHLAPTGQVVTLDGRKSRSIGGEIVSYKWTFSDGSTASGPIQERIYDKPGTYNEILKVTDSNGSIDYDFTVVQIRDMKNPDIMPPSIHTNYYPTLNIKPGDQITFKVRTFNIDSGYEEWDFGDGTLKATVTSKVERKNYRKGKYAEVVHKYSKPGHYIVHVERESRLGFKAMSNLHVEVTAP